MGYHTYVSGEIEIDPPIPWSQVQKRIETQQPRAQGWRTHEYVVRDEAAVEEGVIDYAEGVSLLYRVVEIEADTFTRKVVAIVPDTEEEGRAWQQDVVAALSEIVDDFPVDGEGTARRFEGYLYFEGEENDDLWRAYIIDGKPVVVEAEIVWPDPYQRMGLER